MSVCLQLGVVVAFGSPIPAPGQLDSDLPGGQRRHAPTRLVSGRKTWADPLAFTVPVRMTNYVMRSGNPLPGRLSPDRGAQLPAHPNHLHGDLHGTLVGKQTFATLALILGFRL